MKDEIVKWIRDWISKNGNVESKVVIGISGGKDSTIDAALLCEAIGKDRVIPVLMPNGIQSDIADSYAVCNYLGLEPRVVNIEKMYDALVTETRQFSKNGSSFPTDQFKTNEPARLRMTVLYGIAAQVGNCFVINNSNRSECEAGWGTLWGDTIGDFGPLRNLFVSQVVALGDELGLPERLVHKIPSDGMCGLSDEEKLGFTYKELEDTVLNKNINDKALQKIKSSEWKRKLMNIPAYKPENQHW